MAGAANIARRPYPHGPIEIILGGYVPNGLGDNTTPVLIDTWIAPFDCKVRRVTYFYTKGPAAAAHLDLMTLRTIDATKKSIVDVLNASADLAGVEQTLHADIANFKIVTGNGIEMLADSSQANEQGTWRVQIELDPEYTRPQA